MSSKCGRWAFSDHRLGAVEIAEKRQRSPRSCSHGQAGWVRILERLVSAYNAGRRKTAVFDHCASRLIRPHGKTMTGRIARPKMMGVRQLRSIRLTRQIDVMPGHHTGPIMNDIGPLRDRRKATGTATIDRSHSDLAGEVPALPISVRLIVGRKPRHNLNRCGGVFRMLSSRRTIMTRKDRTTWPAHQ